MGVTQHHRDMQVIIRNIIYLLVERLKSVFLDDKLLLEVLQTTLLYGASLYNL